MSVAAPPEGPTVPFRLPQASVYPPAYPPGQRGAVISGTMTRPCYKPLGPGPHGTATHTHGCLAGGQGQPHQAGPVDGGDTVPDAEGPGALGRAPVKQVGDDSGGQQ